MLTTCTEETRQCIEDTDIDEDIEQMKLRDSAYALYWRQAE